MSTQLVSIKHITIDDNTHNQQYNFEPQIITLSIDLNNDFNKEDELKYYIDPDVSPCEEYNVSDKLFHNKNNQLSTNIQIYKSKESYKSVKDLIKQFSSNTLPKSKLDATKKTGAKKSVSELRTIFSNDNNKKKDSRERSDITEYFD
jgi:hypothetical protein